MRAEGATWWCADIRRHRLLGIAASNLPKSRSRALPVGDESLADKAEVLIRAARAPTNGHHQTLLAGTALKTPFRSPPLKPNCKATNICCNHFCAMLFSGFDLTPYLTAIFGGSACAASWICIDKNLRSLMAAAPAIKAKANLDATYAGGRCNPAFTADNGRRS